MWCLTLTFVIGTVLILQGQAQPQYQTRCSQLDQGGQCVDKRQPCPSGSVEYVPYSNYLGCQSVTHKCCKNTLPTKPDTYRACGVGSLDPSSKILDGLLTGVCDWPFVVSIRALLRTSSRLTYEGTSHACQGVIVDRQWVLTSPFCILSAASKASDAPNRMLVVAGEYNVSGIDIDPLTGRQQEQLIPVASVHVFPSYRYTSQEQIVPFNNTKEINSDGVALIKLREPITGRCSGVACLPTPTEAANQCGAYDDCIITGWGFSTEAFNQGLRDELLLGRVRLSSQTACEFLTNRFGLTATRPRGTICQSPRYRNTDSCLGDEGGAVLCSDGARWTVRGILPFNMCVNGRYNLYVTDVAKYLSWIQNTMMTS